MIYLVSLILLICLLLLMTVRVAREYERYSVNRMGRFKGLRGPGLVVIIPLIEQAWKFDTRVKVIELPVQHVITRDNVSMSVTPVFSYEIVDPERTGGDPGWSLRTQMQQAVCRVVGEFTFDQIIGDQKSLNDTLKHIVGGDNPDRGWVIHVADLKNITLPPELQTSLQKEMIAKREGQAKRIAAEGELAAADNLTKAARLMSQYPESFQLRALQSAETVSSEQNATVILPFTYDLLDGIFPEKQQADDPAS